MRHIKAPEEYEPEIELSVFLAGGITDCPDWQAGMVHAFSETSLAVLNPRRDNFPIHDPFAARSQIEWEFRHLHAADAILFWFPKETPCPIALYELGKWTISHSGRGEKPIFIGTHPEYKRRQDVEIQTRLVRPTMLIYDRLDRLANAVKRWANDPRTKI